MVQVEVFGAPPFGKLGVPLMSGIGKRLAELLVSPRPADVFRRAAPRCLDQHGVCQRNNGERALDLDAVRPAVTEVVVVFEGFRAGVLDCRQERDLACIDRAIPPFLVGQAKADVADLEFVEMGIRPAHRGLQDLMQSAEPDAPRHDNAPHHHRFDMIKSNLQADQGTCHRYAASMRTGLSAWRSRFHSQGSNSGRRETGRSAIRVALLHNPQPYRIGKRAPAAKLDNVHPAHIRPVTVLIHVHKDNRPHSHQTEKAAHAGCVRRIDPAGHLSARQYARLVDEWVTAIGLRREDYGTHSLRRTKAAMIYKATGNLRAIQILLGHSKIENTVRYLGVDIEDALELAEHTEI